MSLLEVRFVLAGKTSCSPSTGAPAGVQLPGVLQFGPLPPCHVRTAGKAPARPRLPTKANARAMAQMRSAMDRDEKPALRDTGLSFPRILQLRSGRWQPSIDTQRRRLERPRRPLPLSVPTHRAQESEPLRA